MITSKDQGSSQDPTSFPPKGPIAKKVPVPFRSVKIGQDSQRIKLFLDQYRENEQAWAYTETALTIFLVAVFILFAIRPAVITVTGLLGEIKAKEELVLKIRKKINSIVQAQDTYALVQSRHQTIEAFLPNSPHYTHTAAQIQGTSQDTNLNISQVNFTIKEDKNQSQDTKKSFQSNVTPVVFSTNTTARYQDFLLFLDQLLRNRRLITPQQVTLSLSKQDTKNQIGDDQITVNLQGNSYFWHE